MILAGTTIKQLILNKKLIIEPFSLQSLQPASIDCRLGNTFLSVDDKRMAHISLKDEVFYNKTNLNEITIPPHSFILATTQEYLKLPLNLTAFVEGRSSIGRIGLFIQNAGWVDPGFEGRLTLELYNANSLPIRLKAGRRICQLVFCHMDTPAKTPYTGKYQNQTSTTGSKINFDEDL